MVSEDLISKELQRIKNLRKLITEIANEDDVLSQDETDILESIEADLIKYVERLNNHRNQDTTDLKVRDELRAFKKEIFLNARNVAAKDNRFYENEWHLLEKLDVFVNNGI